jgi:hypothetical protein
VHHARPHLLGQRIDGFVHADEWIRCLRPWYRLRRGSGCEAQDQ